LVIPQVSLINDTIVLLKNEFANTLLDNKASSFYLGDYSMIKKEYYGDK